MIRWQILIVTQKSRYEMLGQLMGALDRQIAELGMRRKDRIGVLVGNLEPGGLFQIGDARERLRKEATADYISFVDDDDWIAPTFIQRILWEIERHAPEYVGFEVASFQDWTQTKRDFHTLAARCWYETDTAYFRDISHINPIRRDLAMCVPMSGGFGEDARWAGEMRSRQLLKSERYIDEVMYYYLYRTRKNDAMDAYHPARMKLIEDDDK